MDVSRIDVDVSGLYTECNVETSEFILHECGLGYKLHMTKSGENMAIGLEILPEFELLAMTANFPNLYWLLAGIRLIMIDFDHAMNATSVKVWKKDLDVRHMRLYVQNSYRTIWRDIPRQIMVGYDESDHLTRYELYQYICNYIHDIEPRLHRVLK